MSFTPSTIAWLLIGVLAAVAEIVIPSFGFIIVTAAAVPAAVAAAAGAGAVVQILLFVVCLMAGLFLLRPRLVERWHTPPLPSRTSPLVGREGQVTQDINPTTGTGRVLVGGEDWAARCAAPLAAGTIVRVAGADGIVLIVEPKNGRR